MNEKKDFNEIPEQDLNNKQNEVEKNDRGEVLSQEGTSSDVDMKVEAGTQSENEQPADPHVECKQSVEEATAQPSPDDNAAETKESPSESAEMAESAVQNDEQHVNKRFTSSQKISSEKKKVWSSWAKTISAGVIGSVLTLSIIPFTNYSDLFDSETSSQQSQQSSSGTSLEEANSSGSVQVEATAASNSSIADMVEEAAPAIVGVVNVQKQTSSYYSPFEQQSETDESVESGSGSGVIFKKDSDYAYIVTNYHVIEGADEIEVSLDSGDRTTAQLVGGDALSDLAVLKIESSYASSVLSFGDSSTLRAGEEVIAIGNPLGLDLSRTVTQGIVSAVDRTVSVTTSAGDWDLNVIQTDAAINPGNSGGALLNTAGQVVGINSLKISDDGVEGLGFAIPSNDLVPIINEILEKGSVQRVYLGVGLMSISEVPTMYLERLNILVEEGIIITSVESGSAADDAGLEVQDVIVKIDDQSVANSTELRKYLYSNLEVGDQVTIEFYRNGELNTATVTLDSNTAVTTN
ncbi:MAG: trypsin-like peptidase domain-containing protein [Bacillus sp. (in: firmicutes)]